MYDEMIRIFIYDTKLTVKSTIYGAKIDPTRPIKIAEPKPVALAEVGYSSVPSK
jgi:hypothetical protein